MFVRQLSVAVRSFRRTDATSTETHRLQAVPVWALWTRVRPLRPPRTSRSASSAETPDPRHCNGHVLKRYRSRPNELLFVLHQPTIRERRLHWKIPIRTRLRIRNLWKIQILSSDMGLRTKTLDCYLVIPVIVACYICYCLFREC